MGFGADVDLLKALCMVIARFAIAISHYAESFGISTKLIFASPSEGRLIFGYWCQR